MMVPTRYLAWFVNDWQRTGYKSRSVVAWQCKLCGKSLRPNTAGAQSHIAKHVRERQAEGGPR